MITLQDLPLGARVRLADGEAGTIVLSNFTRVRVLMDTKRQRTFTVHDAEGNEKEITAASTVYRDVAPASETEVLDGSNKG